MKILFATESYWPNADGGALFERRLVQGLTKAGHSLAVWAPGSRLRSYRERDGASRIYREKSSVLLANRKYRISFWTFFSGRRVIKAELPEIIHIHNFGPIGLAALWWARRYRIPVLATNHFMPENLTLNIRLPGRRRFITWLVWRYLVALHNRCNLVTSPTPTAINLLKQHGLKVAAQAVSNGVDTKEFRPRLPRASIAKKYGISRTQPVVLYLGRVDGEKRIDVLIKAMPLVLKLRQAQLVIGGSGKAITQLKQLVTKLQLGKQVKFAGFIADSDKAAVYNAASVFVIASPAELQSIVTLEAMSSGLAVVATDVAALKELCQPGINGYLFANENHQQLAGYLLELLRHPAKHRQFGKASRKIVLAHHDNQTMLKTYEALYRKLIKQVG